MYKAHCHVYKRLIIDPTQEPTESSEFTLRFFGQHFKIIIAVHTRASLEVASVASENIWIQDKGLKVLQHEMMLLDMDS
jgi:hypothetical protein